MSYNNITFDKSSYSTWRYTSNFKLMGKYFKIAYEIGLNQTFSNMNIQEFVPNSKNYKLIFFKQLTWGKEINL